MTQAPGPSAQPSWAKPQPMTISALAAAGRGTRPNTMSPIAGYASRGRSVVAGQDVVHGHAVPVAVLVDLVSQDQVHHLRAGDAFDRDSDSAKQGGNIILTWTLGFAWEKWWINERPSGSASIRRACHGRSGCPGTPI